MTAAPPVDRAAARRLVAALEHAWTAIRTEHPEVPEVVIVVASRSDPRSRRLNLEPLHRRPLATHQPRPPCRPARGPGQRRRAPTRPGRVLGTLLHEAAHGLAFPGSATQVAELSLRVRFCRPPASSRGGYARGAIAEQLGCGVEVAQRRLPCAT
jgi:hypothetical protein